MERVQALLVDPKRPLRKIPRRQRRAPAKPLDDCASSFSHRASTIVEAFRIGAWSMQPIAEYFGVSRMTVSRAEGRYEDLPLDHALPNPSQDYGRNLDPPLTSVKCGRPDPASERTAALRPSRCSAAPPNVTWET